MADTAINPGAGVITLTGYAPLIVQSYGTGGVATLTVAKLPTLFPAQTVKVLNDNGTFNNEWYRYLSASLESSTTGINALDPTAVQDAIEFMRSAVVTLQNLTVAIDKMAQQNAAAVKAAVTVVQQAALPGATSIPPVQERVEAGGGE